MVSKALIGIYLKTGLVVAFLMFPQVVLAMDYAKYLAPNHKRADQTSFQFSVYGQDEKRWRLNGMASVERGSRALSGLRFENKHGEVILSAFVLEGIAEPALASLRHSTAKGSYFWKGEWRRVEDLGLDYLRLDFNSDACGDWRAENAKCDKVIFEIDGNTLVSRRIITYDADGTQHESVQGIGPKGFKGGVSGMTVRTIGENRDE